MALAPPPPPVGRRGILSKARDLIARIPFIGGVVNLPDNIRIMIDEWLARGTEYCVDSLNSPVLSVAVNGVAGGVLTGLGLKEGNTDAVAIGNYLLTRLVDYLQGDKLTALQLNVQELSTAVRNLDIEGIKRALVKVRLPQLPSLKLPSLPAPSAPKPTAPSPPPAPTPTPAPKKVTRRFR